MMTEAERQSLIVVHILERLHTLVLYHRRRYGRTPAFFVVPREALKLLVEETRYDFSLYSLLKLVDFSVGQTVAVGHIDGR